MSTFNRNTLALALAAALLPASAFAVTLGAGATSPGDQLPEKIASADIINNATVITLTEDAFLTIQATDNIIGRTTGFGIRLRLSNGAEFTPTGPGVNNAVLSAALAESAPGALDGWTAQVLAGDGTGIVVLSVTPQSSSSVGIGAGDLLTLPNIVLDNLAALQTSGARVNLTAEFFDSNSTNPILNNVTTPLLESGNPFAFTCNTAGTFADTDARIDVGVTATQPSKTFFSSTGAIGVADQGTFNAGDIVVAKDTAFASFKFFNTDAFSTKITGNFGAFKGAQIGTTANFNTFVVPGVSATCTVANAVGTAVTNAAADTITFTYTGADLGPAPGAAVAPGGSDGPFAMTLCFEVAAAGTTTIDASTVTQTTTLTRSGTTFATPSCDLLPLQFNGSVVKVFTFNPAGNTTQESFARITNWGNTGGKVTVEGWDDKGAAALSPVTFNLAAGETLQVNSNDLENGNAGKGLVGAFGPGTIVGGIDVSGKWRLVVTGEFDGLHVTSLNRNNTVGTLTNLTDSDNLGEQKAGSK
jgi:hypothetical protein